MAKILCRHTRTRTTSQRPQHTAEGNDCRLYVVNARKVIRCITREMFALSYCFIHIQCVFWSVRSLHAARREWEWSVIVANWEYELQESKCFMFIVYECSCRKSSSCCRHAYNGFFRVRKCSHCSFTHGSMAFNWNAAFTVLRLRWIGHLALINAFVFTQRNCVHTDNKCTKCMRNLTCANNEINQPIPVDPLDESVSGFFLPPLRFHRHLGAIAWPHFSSLMIGDHLSV